MKLIILDRDGVINEDSDHFIKSAAEWVPIPGSIEAMAHLNKAGYTLAVATNQSGIARGLYDLATLDAMHAKLRRLLTEHDGEVAYIAYCPHLGDEQCNCRKPKPGMLHEIAAYVGADLTQATVVGDSLRDWQAAAAAGANYVQVRTGKGERTLAGGQLPADIPVFDNLSDYAHSLTGTPTA
ncbi:D-glycero-beta-D-manno-heptose 1,7-bisphosphate 7-phosphatase [Thiothrix nivea]|uniref:D,D-heptose 1,7-bisphosphate phosphatase n=1 Tax=Thiothrix nivea (strain ATCC 35100 / DSM 5205 / JP2) TaxID=870187 RepID=A0A656HF24_THINJ|nr:D-glycero-beta-D-manno-heptose 1,7-bisphosphate 7-phosphatase [Thiothrix nivea]EIJ35528.1 D-alpha,beta-D-heptose 1,7-bisphosphate phosphatase [Thiothrix nivea DSM 5205]